MAQQVLEALLEKYMNDGVTELTDTKIFELKEFERFGSSLKIVKAFGGKAAYLNAVQELQKELYIA